MSNRIKGGLSQPPGAVTNAIIWARVDKMEFSGGLVRPGYKDDAGYDLCASRQVVVPAQGFAKIPTNVKVAVPRGTWAMLVGRSSTFHNKQLLVQTAVIDGGYRGELWAIVRNMRDEVTIVKKQERILQLILMPLMTPEAVETNELPPGDRGEAGFGSTGE